MGINPNHLIGVTTIIIHHSPSANISIDKNCIIILGSILILLSKYTVGPLNITVKNIKPTIIAKLAIIHQNLQKIPIHYHLESKTNHYHNTLRLLVLLLPLLA